MHAPSYVLPLTRGIQRAGRPLFMNGRGVSQCVKEEVVVDSSCGGWLRWTFCASVCLALAPVYGSFAIDTGTEEIWCNLHRCLLPPPSTIACWRRLTGYVANGATFTPWAAVCVFVYLSMERWHPLNVPSKWPGLVTGFHKLKVCSKRFPRRGFIIWFTLLPGNIDWSYFLYFGLKENFEVSDFLLFGNFFNLQVDLLLCFLNWTGLYFLSPPELFNTNPATWVLCCLILITVTDFLCIQGCWYLQFGLLLSLKKGAYLNVCALCSVCLYHFH